MKTYQDLLDALNGLSSALTDLGTAVTTAMASVPPPTDYASVVTIVGTITDQVKALTAKLVPPPPPVTPPPAPAPAPVPPAL